MAEIENDKFGIVNVYEIDNAILSEIGLLNEKLAEIASDLHNNGFCQISLIFDRKTINKEAMAIQETLNTFCIQLDDIKEVFVYDKKPMPLNFTTFKDMGIQGMVILITQELSPLKTEE